MRLRFVLAMALLAGCATLPGEFGYCGSGTQLIDGVCVSLDTCGANTHDVDGSCVADTGCGMGTTLVGTECVALGSVLCGAGTSFDGAQCVAVALSCGPGTVQQGAQCVPSGMPVMCGPGTILKNSECVPTGVAVTCGPGTMLQGSQCVASGTTVTCGPGTVREGDQCVAHDGEITCGPGTTQSGSQCVGIGPAPGTYWLRSLVTSIPADGYSTIPIFAIGALSNGMASTEPVVLTVVPAYAGTVSPAAFKLGVQGTTVYFTPCASTSPACTGTFEVDMALASNPSAVVASTGTLALERQVGVGSSAPCMTGGNVLFFNGDRGDYIHAGTATITQGDWSASGGQRYLTISVTPSSSSLGLWWDLDFSTAQLGQDLAVNTYRQAERAAFASPGHPGIDIGGDGRGCNNITGAFQVESISWEGSTLKDFTASFEQHCDGESAALRGCVHFEQ